MGEQKVKKLQKGSENLRYLSQLMNDIDALEEMLADGAFASGTMHIGAEQEFCLVAGDWTPTSRAKVLLEAIDDPHFTHEIALYNLEINLDPQPLTADCFSRMHKQLDTLLEKTRQAGETMGVKPLLTGILTTLAQRHLDMSYMTPIPRYLALNQKVKEMRKDDFELHIKGVDEINLKHDSVLYEGCNTSFQTHLQITQGEFRQAYNWAQAIAGPVLSICANSPLLMGRELWEETRIALFTQSVDSRASTFYLDERESRVGFGNEWATGSAVDFYKESIVRFRSLLTTDIATNSLEEWRSGKAPKLKALGLHNGTVYKWNRLCFGQNDGVPHLRIEARYMPSGPSTLDEIANMMLWVGIMKGRPAAMDDIDQKMDFRDAKANFFNAARYGMAAQFYWDGQIISSADLLLNHLLPMAYRGLYSMQVSPVDVEKYLSVIEKRIRSRSGSRWQVAGYRKLRRTHSRPDALKVLAAATYSRQQKGYSVDAWRLPEPGEGLEALGHRTVGDIMNTRIISAQEDDSSQLVFRIMQWKNIHHVPILNDHQELSGIVSWQDMKKAPAREVMAGEAIGVFMQTRLITVEEDTPLIEAKRKMDEHNIHCLPVVAGRKLLGIITSNDL